MLPHFSKTTRCEMKIRHPNCHHTPHLSKNRQPRRYSLAFSHDSYSCMLTLALTTSRPTNHACLHRGDRLIWVLSPIELCRSICEHGRRRSKCKECGGGGPGTFLEATEVDAALPPVLADATHDACTDALLAPAAHPPVLADTATAALLADAALPSVLAEASAAALLALFTLPPVLTNGTATALLAMAAAPPVLAEAATAAILAPAALPSVLAHATAAALLAGAAMPPVLAKAAAATVLAAVALPPVLAEAAAAAVLAPAGLPPVLAPLLSHVHARPAGTAGPTFVQQGRRDSSQQIPNAALTAPFGSSFREKKDHSENM